MQVLGLGLDLVDLGRFERLWRRRRASMSRKIFTPAELAYCLKRRRPAMHLAARWAAKEAFFKALGAGWARGGGFRNVEVVHAAGGAPRLRLSGKAARAARAAGGAEYLLTLTHGEKSAAAAVILLAGRRRK
jgi:holo-[acyl-carrier protein] synthase